MPTKLIKLSDGVLVEVETQEYEAKQISGNIADKVSATFDEIQPLLLKVCKPVVSAIKELHEHISVENVEVELGLSFEGEGNIYVVKSKVGANVIVRMTLKNL